MIKKVIVVGNVGADQEVRALEGGVKVARIRLATTERIYNRQTQETKEHTEWHNITLWRNLADVVDRYVRKGSQLYIEGSLRTREWTDKDGNRRFTTEIVANDMKMLGRRSDNASSSEYGNATSGYSAPTSGYGASSTSGYGASTSAGYGAASSGTPSMNASEIASSAGEDVDDLPF